MKNMTNDEKWFLNHISNNPNISFGSLYRDSCYYIKNANRESWLFQTIKKLVKEGIITETREEELHRDKLLNKLINEKRNNNPDIT